ncbi:MAG TPA: hypothetical protein VK973_15700, partial [Arenicellales bacterium]|nr:hypothetical protein [Arenicellales bacterium]
MITDAVIRLFRHLDEGGLAIASSRRLARQVEQRYADWKVDAGAAAWATPRIRVYEDWLAQIWFERFEHGAGAPRLLSDDQELLLWQQVIRRHASKDTPSAVLQLSATARSVRRSWARVHDWRLDWQGIRQYRGADSDAFTDWAGHYERMLAGRNWLSSSQLPQYLVQHAAQWLPDLGCPAVWMGFDVIPPALEALCALLSDHGFEQRRFDGAGITGADSSVVACQDARDQWRRIARWARSTLESEPGTILGVV